MHARPECGAAVREHEPDRAARDQDEPQPAGRAKEIAGRDQRLREPRQRLPALLINGHDLRNDVGQQHDNHRERDHRHEHRIDERRRELLPQCSARLEIIGQSREHFGKASRFTAGRYEPTIERAERPREARHRHRQRFAGRDMRAQRRENSRRLRMIGLLGNGA